jgi:DNA-binding transcriptional ArsR family regulator
MDSEPLEPIPFRNLNDAVHQPIRLAILTVLNEADIVDFSYLKRVLNVTDGNLGRHLEVLNVGGLVDLRKEFIGKRPRTWVAITTAGRSALVIQVEAMRSIVDKFDATTDD